MSNEVIQQVFLSAMFILQMVVVWMLADDNRELKNRIKELEEKTEK